MRANVEAEDAHRAAGGRQEAEEDADEGALARAVRADEPDDAGLEGEREGVECNDAGIALGNLTSRNQCDGELWRGKGPEYLRDAFTSVSPLEIYCI
jgi:hypothetical protein